MTNHGWCYQEISDRFWVREINGNEATEVKIPKGEKILDLTSLPPYSGEERQADCVVEPKTVLGLHDKMLTYFDEKCELSNIIFNKKAYLMKEDGKTVETL
jgi:hypothetical protein